MTVPTPTRKKTYGGDGVATFFATGFYFLENSEVVVTLTLSGGSPVIQTEGVHYTLETPTEVGAEGRVEMVTAPPAASVLTVERTVPFTQVTSFRTAGTFSRAVHEDSMDELTMQTQQLNDRLALVESAGAPGSVVAGNGVSFAGTTLNVGAGAGIQANADTVEVLYGTNPRAVNADAFDNGMANTASRSDHKHSIDVGAASNLVVGQSAGLGASLLLSLADHAHGVPVGAPVTITKAAAVTGASGNFSDADHKHDVSTAAAVTLTDASNTEGGATSLARSDHTHSHGARGGGTLHALATGSVAGFMSAAHFAILNAALAALSHVHAYQAGTQSMPSGIGGSTCIFGTEDYDSDGEYNPATGIYTAKNAGYILVTAGFSLAAAAWVTTSAAVIFLIKNKATVPVIEAAGADVFEAALSRASVFQLTKVVKVAIGDTLQIDLQHNQGAAVNSGGTRSACFVTFDRML